MIERTDELQNFISDLKTYTNEFSGVLTGISRKLPEMESQIDVNILEAKGFLNSMFSSEDENRYGIRKEIDVFAEELNLALEKLKETEKSDREMFADLKGTISLSDSTVRRIDDIYNISENLKVFAINSIVHSQKEGERGKGYRIISGQFIALSGEIAKGMEVINRIGRKISDSIKRFDNRIEEYEQLKKDHIDSVSGESDKLLEISGKSIENFTLILRDILSRMEGIKKPTYNIMVQMQKQDIIQQQMDHLTAILSDLVNMAYQFRKELNYSREELTDPQKRDDFRNINTLLVFMLKTTDKQMNRINGELLKMIDRLEIEFEKIEKWIGDIDSDRQMINDLVYNDENRSREAPIIDLIFQTPRNTIENLLENLEKGETRKQEILAVFREIHDLVQSERGIAGGFIPIIESVNNLLLLAKIEQARNSLNITSDISGSDSFSSGTFSDLEGLIEDMDLSAVSIMEKLETVTKAYLNQKNEYVELERRLNRSSEIMNNSKTLFSGNFESVMQITDSLSREIHGYSRQFGKLRDFHDKMVKETALCSRLLDEIEERLAPFGGSLQIEQCKFRDTAIQKIIQELTVEDERTAIADEYSELDIEKTTGTSITLF